jgi:ribosomal protein S18 acetylase RimI-like enzyme
VAAVRLRPMTEEEYPAWRDVQIREYADDLVRNGRVSGELSMQRAEESFERAMPDGLASKDRGLWIGEDASTGEAVGFLWLGTSEDPGQAWVFGVEVHPELRGNGYGRALMLAFEEEARARGFTRAGLNVFGDNLVARTLYESLGYQEIARQMSKDL